MNNEFEIITVSSVDDDLCKGLALLTIDVVKQGASVGFMDDLTMEQAQNFWKKIFGRVARDEVVLFAARHVPSQQIVGTVQLAVDLPPNQPHRGDVAKMLVHSAYRRRGIASRLLSTLEIEARERSRHILVLDTVTESPAYYLYLKYGWQVVGNIPEYALFPDGQYCSTTYFYKKLN
ncbi:MAG TPA: GNAT family N-acetyltransferase [Sphingobacterium sp.]|jgi:GNAT superfamily N-acetyltransferase|nr:GNAT family N-acetyltransferase [Sphingobacterium sp.]